MVGNLYVPPHLFWAQLDLPSMVDGEAGGPGFSIAAASQTPLDRWPGAEVYWSHDDTNFVLLGRLIEEATMGIALTALGNVETCYAGYWDRTNTVDIEMRGSGIPVTVTEDDVLEDSLNFAMLGGEIIAFRTATQIDGNAYRLSHLLRGRRDTRAGMSDHAIGETFVLLNSAVGNFEANFADIGATRYMRVVPAGGLVTDFDSVSAELSGSRLRPFAPVHVKGTRDGDQNLTITWVARSRARARLLGPARPRACFCEEDRWWLDLYDPAAPTVILRTVEVFDATETIYTAAQQTADGFTPGDPVEVDIARYSKILGIGNVVRYTL